MGIYNKIILPRVIDWACSQTPNTKQREKVIPHASGRILEIGIGSGLNLPFYTADNVDHLTAIDPSKETWLRNKVDTDKLPFEFEFIPSSAEQIPLDSNSFDSVVITFTLCTIPDTAKALAEIRRVLKNNGRLLFCEHGKAPDKAVLQWQNRLNPIWKRFSGGCNLNRDIPVLLESSGFKINNLETMYIPGWKPGSFNYWGSAEVG